MTPFSFISLKTINKIKNDSVKHLIEKTANFLDRIFPVLLSVVFFYLLTIILPWFFIESSTFQNYTNAQPLLYIYEVNDLNKVDFYFQNRSSESKLITKIKVDCSYEHNKDLENEYLGEENFCDLPKVIPQKSIEKVTCQVWDYRGCESAELKVVIAYTKKDQNLSNDLNTYYYPTILQKQ